MKYKQSGWHKESVRHSLAARGIPTSRKYNASKFNLFAPKSEDNYEKCRVCGRNDKMSARHGGYCETCAEHIFMARKTDHKFYALKEMKDEEGFFVHHKMDSVGKNLRQRDIDSMQNEVVGKLDDAMEKGELSGENREKFVREDFRKSSEEYLNGHINRDQYKEEVNRHLAHHLKTYNKTLDIWGWSKGKQKEGGKTNG